MHPIHPFEQPLEVDDLRLRLPERSDLPALRALWNDPSFMWLFPHSYDGMDPRIEMVLELASMVVRRRSALLIEGSGGELLGTVHLNSIWQDTACLGWYVAPEHRRQGIATRAVSAVMLHLLQGNNLAVDARMDEANLASRGLAGKLGLAPTHCSMNGSLAFVTTLGAQIDRIEAAALPAPAAA